MKIPLTLEIKTTAQVKEKEDSYVITLPKKYSKLLKRNQNVKVYYE